MSAPAKSTSPIAPAATKSKDWMKASTLELMSGSEDKLSVLNTKAKERHCHKQVRREERQHREAKEKRAHKEVEARACEEAERAKVEVEKERVESQARVESEQRKVAEVAAKQRVVEVAAKQKAMVQEASKKRAREEPEVGPVGEVQYIFLFIFFCLLTDFFADVCAV